MNYKLHYDLLISKGLERGHNKKNLPYYTESHHIIPKCMGGVDDSSNRVLLTPEEHYVAHLLLVKINKNLKHSTNVLDRLTYRDLCLAVRGMTMGNDKNKHNSRLYGWAKREWIQSISGDNNPMRLVPLTEKARKNMSDAAKKRLANKENHPLYGTNRTNSTKEKLSIALRGRVPHNKGGTMTDEQKHLLSNAQKNNRKTCIYCGMTTNAGNITRYHNEKCKMKTIELG